MRTLAVIAVVLLAGCKKPSTDANTLTVRLGSEPAGLTRLDDRFADGNMTRITLGPLYETLAGRLAKSWSSKDQTLTIVLRDDVKFHDGTPFTSADVKATLEAILNPANATSNFRESLSTLNGIDTPDAHTVVLHWSRPYFLADYTVLNAVPILPAHALKGEWDTLPIHRAPIGTGPFRFEKWEPGSSISYVKFDDRAHVNRIVFRIVKDDIAARTSWERSEFDVFPRMSPVDWKALSKTPWAKREKTDDNAYVWLGFNQRLPQFRDVNTRIALAMLFPYSLVDETVTLGVEPRTTCPYFAAESCDSSVTPIAYDPADAKKKLEEVGWKLKDGTLERDGVKLSFTFVIASQSARMTKTLPLYLDVLKSVGIDAHIETVDISAYMSRVRPHDFDAIALSWSSQDEAQDNFANFHSDAASNFVGYANPEVDTLLEQIRVTADDTIRHGLEREVHRRIYADQAYLFLGRPPLVSRNA
jgi:peptide/nickel transport system substrate-binding protein